MTESADNRPLVGLFRVLVGLVLLVYLGVIVSLWFRTLDDSRATLAQVNAMLAQGVRTTLKSHELILQGLGGELLALGALEHPERGRDLIERMKNIDPGMVGIGLAGPDGQLRLVSGVSPGNRLPNLSTAPESRDSFREVTTGTRLRIGRPYRFAALGDWLVPIRAPLRDENGTLRAVMAAGYAIEDATTAWSRMRLPPEVTVVMLRDDGYLLFRQPLKWPGLPRDQALRATYGEPVEPALSTQLAATHGDGAFFGVELPREGGYHYGVSTRIPEYALHTGAFIARKAVIAGWLDRLPAPTALLVAFLGAGYIAYRRASRRQALAEAEVHGLSAWQRAVLDNAEYGIISTDPDGLIVSFNRAAERLSGRSAGEMIGRATPALLHDPEELARRAGELGLNTDPGFDVLAARARNGDTEERPWTYVHSSGARVPIMLSMSPLRTADGRLTGFLGIAADRSEQQTMKTELRDSEARYRTLFEHSGDAIFLVRDGHIIDCNPAALDMFSGSREQIIGREPDALSPGLQPDGEPSQTRARRLIAAASRQTQCFEWRHQRLDGTTFDAEVSLVALQIGGRPHVLGSVRDISQRKRGEAELARSRQALVERNESLQLLHRLSQRLLGSQALGDILEETKRALLGLSKTPRIAIYLLDADSERLHLATSQGFEPAVQHLGAELPMQGSLNGLALRQKQPLTSSDLPLDERIEPAVQSALVRSGARAAIVLPLIYQDAPLGTIDLIFDHPRQFDDSERRSLTSLANTVGLAIANSRHLDTLAFQARHDSLTRLASRMLLHETFDTLVREDSQTPQAALLLLDLDRFKEINDTLGHHVGDQVLTQIGPRLHTVCDDRCELICRLGGDEFALLLHGPGPTAAAAEVARAILDALQTPFPAGGIEISLGASIGLARFPEHGADSHALLRAADVAMYRAKKLARGVVEYDQGFDDYSTERLALANELAQAMESGQLVLHYQIKFDIAVGDAVGLEALVRWQHPRLGLLQPAAFLDLVEMSEMIHPFTEAVLDMALADKRRLREAGYRLPVAVNLSARNLLDTRCFECLESALRQHGLPPSEIELELTETALMQDQRGAGQLLRRFAGLGVRVAVDDFGTGYSSLAHLRELPLDALKIDQTFVRDMLTDKQDRTIVRSTIALAHNLELKVIAEGVENAQTLELLREMECDQAQGYGLHRPQPLADVMEWLRRQPGASRAS